MTPSFQKIDNSRLKIIITKHILIGLLLTDYYYQGNLYTGGRCTTACPFVNQLFISYFQQPSLKLFDNCTSGSAPSP